MSAIHRKILLAISCVVAAAGPASGAPAEPAVALATDAAEALLGCAIPLATARENLKARGYLIDGETAGGFSTQFKTSEHDSTRRLLGSFATERARQYQVVAGDQSGIRFTPRYRETEYASGALGNQRDVTREFAVPLTAAMAETLKDMQREVCSPLGQGFAPGQERLNLDLDQYLRERCEAKDERACQHLRAK